MIGRSAAYEPCRDLNADTHFRRYKAYLLWFVLFSAALLILLALLGTRGLFKDHFFGYQILYQYQLKKIASNPDFEVLFVGDSSLGNAIDAEQFFKLSGKKCLNLALTGLYGFAGAYNMVKRAISPSVKTVVLMVSLDMLKRKVSYEGYLMTLRKAKDIWELSKIEKIRLLASFLELVTSPINLMRILKNYIGLNSRQNTIKNDYIKQKSTSAQADKTHGYSAVFNADKTAFLKKLNKYCQDHQVQLIYIQGPILAIIGKNSNEYISAINKLLASALPNMVFVKNIMLIEEDHVGDSIDHVHPKFKKAYTEKYYILIKPHLYQATNSTE